MATRLVRDEQAIMEARQRGTIIGRVVPREFMKEVEIPDYTPGTSSSQSGVTAEDILAEWKQAHITCEADKDLTPFELMRKVNGQ